MLSKTYTVNYSNLEGGHWTLVSSTGDNYLPVDLPNELKQHGLKVKCKLSVQKDASSMHMTGEIVRITTYDVISRP